MGEAWGRVSPSLLGRGPENVEFFYLQMVCLGVFHGAKFNILVATKSCKKSYVKCMGNEKKSYLNMVRFFTTLFSLTENGKLEMQKKIETHIFLPQFAL